MSTFGPRKPGMAQDRAIGADAFSFTTLSGNASIRHRSGRIVARLNLTFCDLSCSWLTRAHPPIWRAAVSVSVPPVLRPNGQSARQRAARRGRQRCRVAEGSVTGRTMPVRAVAWIGWRG
jgi:hypothetical protein